MKATSKIVARSSGSLAGASNSTSSAGDNMLRSEKRLYVAPSGDMNGSMARHAMAVSRSITWSIS